MLVQAVQVHCQPTFKTSWSSPSKFWASEPYQSKEILLERHLAAGSFLASSSCVRFALSGSLSALQRVYTAKVACPPAFPHHRPSPSPGVHRKGLAILAFHPESVPTVTSGQSPPSSVTIPAYSVNPAAYEGSVTALTLNIRNTDARNKIRETRFAKLSSVTPDILSL